LFGLAMAAELGWTVMVLLGFALSFSSTVFAVKVLDAPTRPSGAHPRSRHARCVRRRLGAS
jgi:predicted Kef-type K+ transport protein